MRFPTFPSSSALRGARSFFCTFFSVSTKANRQQWGYNDPTYRRCLNRRGGRSSHLRPNTFDLRWRPPNTLGPPYDDVPRPCPVANALRIAHDASPPLCHALHLAADALKDDPEITLTHIVVGAAASTKALAYHAILLDRRTPPPLVLLSPQLPPPVRQG